MTEFELQIIVRSNEVFFRRLLRSISSNGSEQNIARWRKRMYNILEPYNTSPYNKIIDKLRGVVLKNYGHSGKLNQTK